jgi:hypothetical protein
MDVHKLASDHVHRFNSGVTTGDFSAFVASFAEDATMSFEGTPAGPYVGRAAIEEAYRTSPPDDTISIVAVRPTGALSATVEYAWRGDPGRTGGMSLTWRPDGRVRLLEIRLS